MKKWIGTGLLLMVFLLSACVPGQSGNIERLDQKGYESLIAEEEVVLLDVRTPNEFNQGHIPDAVLLPVDQITQAEEIVPDKSTPVVVYCRSGNRSSTAAKQLDNMGYKRVYDLGGIQSWRGDVVRDEAAVAA